MTRRREGLYTAGFLMICTTGAHAFDGATVFVVEGTRLQQSLDDSGAPVTVLTADDFAELGFPFALDAIATAPGVSINQSGAFGGAASVSIRGNRSDQTLVLMDGVPVGDTASVGGAFDFSRLDVAQIERIEILRGPQSTLWGSEAIGGVISIQTARPVGGIAGFAEGGSFGTVRGGASLSGRSGNGGWRLGASASSTDGISKADESAGNTETDGFRNQAISGQFDQRIGRGRLAGSVFGSSAETEFDSFDFNAPGAVADGNERSETDEATFSLRADLPQSDDMMHTLIVGGSAIERRNFTEAAPAFSASGRRAILRYQGRATVNEALGFAFGGDVDIREADGESTSILSAFLLNELSLQDKFTLTTGVRIDDHNTFGRETTARVNAAWELRSGMTMRASFGQGFKAPSLFQQTFFCCGAAAPDPSLAPERSEGFDVGLLINAPRLTVDAGLFRQTTEDLIDFSFPVGAYFNISEAETEGLELFARADVLTWLDVQIAYTHTEAVGADGQPLQRIPRNTADVVLAIEPAPQWNANLLVRYNGEEDDSFGQVDSWTRVDFNARRRIGPRLEAYLRAENILDADYQQVFGYGTPGRSVTLGFRIEP